MQQRDLFQQLLGTFRQLRLLDNAAEPHEITFFHGLLYLFLQFPAQIDLLHNAVYKLNLPQADLKVFQSSLTHSGNRKGYNLRIRRCRRNAHQFNPGLVKFALAASLCLFIAIDTADIGKLERQLFAF